MKVKFTTTINDEIVKQMKIQAINEDISVAELIEKCFALYISLLESNNTNK